MMAAIAQPGGERRIYIAQGEHAVCGEEGAVISTLLGSCVAVCLWDPVGRLGGMNHFLLPDEGCSPTGMSGYGTHAMELVVNGLIRRGADRHRFRAKVFGGAVMIAGLSDVGRCNARFALDYLHREAIPCVAHSLGGTRARRVEFWPTEGRARQKMLSDTAIRVFATARTVAETDVELF